MPRADVRLTILGVVMFAGFAVVLALGDLQQNSVAYILLYGTLWLVYIIATRVIFKETPSTPAALSIIIAGAVAFRLIMLFAPPTLSTDLFRYVWEGHVLSGGFSPYQYAPTSPILAHLTATDLIWPLVQQRDVVSPYPPLAQLLGFLDYTVFGSTTFSPKLIATLFDLGVCAAIVGLLRVHTLPPERVIAYAWCPLPVIEFAQSGHNDAPMLLLFVASIWLTHRQRPGWAAVVLGLAALAKFTPLFALPLFMVAWYKPQRDRRALIIYPGLTLLVIALGYAPFLWLGHGAIGSILDYTSSWFDNESVFGVFYGVAHVFLPLTAAVTAAKGASLLALLALFATLIVHPMLRARALPSQLLIFFGGVLVVASTVHAWYVTWLAIFLPFVLDTPPFSCFRFANAVLIFSATVSLPYLTYTGTADYYLVRPLEYWPVYGYVLVGFAVCYSNLRKRV